MINKEAKKLIRKIIEDLELNGIITNTIVNDLKALRPYAVEEKRPVVAKAIRLMYQHVEAFETFAVPVPNDEDIVDEETGEVIASDTHESDGPTERILYLINLIQNEENHRNKQEIRQFNAALKEYAEIYGED